MNKPESKPAVNPEPKPEGQPKGTSDESIGRPGPWREGRYEQRGKPVDDSVVEPGQTNQPPPDTVSTPVTQRDYENLEQPPAKSKAPANSK